MPKYNFYTKYNVFLDSIYRGNRDHFPDIAIATAKFPISRYRDDRDLSVCLGRTPKIGIQPVCYHWQNKCQTHCFSVIAYPDIHTFTELDGWKKAKKELNLSSPSSLVKNVGHYQKENVLLTGTKFASGGGGTTSYELC